MAIRTGTVNPALGLPAFGVVQGAPFTVPLGTITEGYDDVNNRNDEYIFLLGAAGIAIGDEVTYDVAYQATEVLAPNGQAVAIAAVLATQGGWFRLKRRGVIA